MGTKKLINISSSPPISYKRHCDSKQQPKGNGYKNITTINNNNNTCCSVGTNTTTMFTKLRNYFTQIRKPSSSAHHRHEKLTNCNSIPRYNDKDNTYTSSSSNNSSYSTNMFNVINIVMLVLLALINSTTSNPVFVDNPNLAQFQSGRNIRHLPCIVRKSGRSGVCMFAIDCIKQNGTHLGTCIDRFYFGSCCDIKEEGYPEIADNSIDQNTISHRFTPESSTMPTSALFKITTLSPGHYHGNISSSITTSSSGNTVTQQDVTQMLNSVTQSFAGTTLDDTPRPTTLVSHKPHRTTTTTTKPGHHTTHKHSQFVIRTTAKPTKIATASKPVHHYGTTGSKPTQHNTTTKKKTTPSTSTSTSTTSSTTTTTTRKPLLTTTDAKLQQDELQTEITTPPTKLFTYQIVETTVFTPTEPTRIIDFVTTERYSVKTTTKKPQTTSTTTTTTTTSTTTAPPQTTTPKPKETTTVETTTTTAPRPTSKPKPQTTRKPSTTKKPTTHKRTTVKPTRKPVTTTTQATDSKTQSNSTTIQTTQEFSTTNTLASNKTTSAPRPKPKPTASIVKVTKPTPIPTSTTTTTTTTTTTKKPTTTTSLPPQTTTQVNKVQTTTTTTSKKPTTTTTTEATTPISTTTITTTPPPSSTQKPLISSTTHKPGLVTWTNIDGEPVVEPNETINSDWIPVTAETPLITNNKVEEDEYSTEKTSYEESDVSVSSSVSAMMNNQTVIIKPPQKPLLQQKPTTTTTTTTTTSTTTTSTTRKPTTTEATSTTAKPTTTTRTPTTTTTTTPTTTERPSTTSRPTTTEEEPEISSTTISHQFTTEGLASSSSETTTPSAPSAATTEDITTEGLNLNMTTMSPASNGLEGVDYRQVCGRRMFPEPRIVGGSNAAFGRWPWQISLRQWRTSTYLHKCGAALLNENWAITAAHCVDNVPPSDLLLRLGEYDLAEEEEPYGYQERRVQIVASHPQFDPRTFEYDLALLRFYEPVVFQPNIIPVCVPQDDENFIGQTAFVTGWGRLYEDGPLPSVLQEVAVPVINNTICETMYRSAGYIEHIPHIFICAGWKKGGYDSCEGDSGGPMVLQRESDKRFQLGGVISWGIGCAEANQPGVYTRISEFRDWINQILQF